MAAFIYLFISQALPLLGLVVGYVVIAVFTLLGKRWAWGISVIVAFSLMIRWLPMVLINAWMFISGHELYQDSPATIFIVLLYAVLFAIPATFLCGLYIWQRKRIWQLIRAA